MTHFGKIKSYDSGKGSGMITPKRVVTAIVCKTDLQQEASEPKAGQRYGYETSQVDGGKAHATNLQPDDGHRAQAEKQQA